MHELAWYGILKYNFPLDNSICHFGDGEWNRALLTMALISGADVSMSALEPQ